MHTIALCGLGQMGLPIAQRLAASADVLAFDISPDRRRMADEHPRISTTDQLEDLAACETVVLSLPSPAISRSVLRTLADRMSSGSVVIETSTVLPGDVREWSGILKPVGVETVDAAVLSGVAQMASGSATLLVGGDEAVISRIAPTLESMGGAGWHRFGDLGAGMAAKVINNGVAHATMVVLVEAFALAKAEQVSLEDIATMLEREDGGLRRPLTHRVMERMASADYTGGMRLDAARKDSTLALAMAQSSGVPLFATQAAQSVYDIAMAAGLESADYSALATLWEQWTGTSLSYRKDDQ